MRITKTASKEKRKPGFSFAAEAVLEFKNRKETCKLKSFV
jgi:hypothetical protein